MNSFARRSVGVVMGALMAVNTACYGYVPPTTGVAPKVGEQVRVRMNADGTNSLANYLGPRVEYAEGTLSEVRSDGTVVVGVNSVRLLDGIDQFWSGQSVVTFPSRYVVEVQVRALDGRRTRIATIAAIVGFLGIFAIAIAAGGIHGGPDAGSGQPPP